MAGPILGFIALMWLIRTITSILPCAKTYIMIARGSTGEYPFGGMDDVVDQVRSQTPYAVAWPVYYPAQLGAQYDTSVDAGSATLRSMIIFVVDNCPDANIALLGYSQVRCPRYVITGILTSYSGRRSRYKCIVWASTDT